MCGRLNITDDPFAQLVSEIVGVPFRTKANNDLRPTESVSVFRGEGSTLGQQDLSWGIKPDWAKRVIINAQAESVAVKPTFRNAFQRSRVIVPCSGWYEWSAIDGTKKKYLISDPEHKPLFMAGIALGDKLVTLTTKPNKQYAEYHHRMPLLIPGDALQLWVQEESALDMLMSEGNEKHFEIQKILDD
ncbi:SOS response-associated peptidase [Vibrio sp. HN007]|uniref:SOS response-associated peptidase n=1 Tax=Vibrio iocasae TaxID=3098914 RepID=UPI0035D40787